MTRRIVKRLRELESRSGRTGRRRAVKLKRTANGRIGHVIVGDVPLPYAVRDAAKLPNEEGINDFLRTTAEVELDPSIGDARRPCDMVREGIGAVDKPLRIARAEEPRRSRDG